MTVIYPNLSIESRVDLTCCKCFLLTGAVVLASTGRMDAIGLSLEPV